MNRVGAVVCAAAIGCVLVTALALPVSSLSCKEFNTETWLTGVDPDGAPLATVHVVNAAAGEACNAWAPHAAGQGWLVWQDNAPDRDHLHGLPPVVYAQDLGTGDRRTVDLGDLAPAVRWKETAIRDGTWYFAAATASNDLTLYAHNLSSDETAALRTWNGTQVVILSDDTAYAQRQVSGSPTVTACPLDQMDACQDISIGGAGAPGAALTLRAASHDWLFLQGPDEPSDHLEQWQYWLFHRGSDAWQQVVIAPDAESGSSAHGHRLAHAEIVGNRMTFTAFEPDFPWQAHERYMDLATTTVGTMERSDWGEFDAMFVTAPEVTVLVSQEDPQSSELPPPPAPPDGATDDPDPTPGSDAVPQAGGAEGEAARLPGPGFVAVGALIGAVAHLRGRR